MRRSMVAACFALVVAAPTDTQAYCLQLFPGMDGTASFNGDISLAEGRRASRQVAWSNADLGPLISTPIVVGDYTYTLGRDGTVSAWDAATGIPMFSEVIPVPEGQDEATYSASPVAANGRMYIAAEHGDIHVVEVGPFLRILSTNPVGEAVFATPAISDGYLIVRGKSHLFAFSR